MRPFAKWGYYIFPLCFNNQGEASCKPIVLPENDALQWLWDESDIILPSTYLNEKIPINKRGNFVRGRVREAKRVANQVTKDEKPKTYIYLRFVYTDTIRPLTYDDLSRSLSVMKSEGADGAILWGSSNDLNTR